MHLEHRAAAGGGSGIVEVDAIHDADECRTEGSWRAGA
jgi:hypothetical protein